MRQASKRIPESAEKTVRDIRRATRRHHSAEEKIRIVLEGLRGEDSIAELCRKERINQKPVLPLVEGVPGGGQETARYDAFEPELAGMGEDGRAIAFDMLVEPDAGASLGQHARKRGLAGLKRIAPQVVAVQFDEVEGVEEYAVVSAVVTDEIERGNAVVIAGDSFAVDHAGARA